MSEEKNKNTAETKAAHPTLEERVGIYSAIGGK